LTYFCHLLSVKLRPSGLFAATGYQSTPVNHILNVLLLIACIQVFRVAAAWIIATVANNGAFGYGTLSCHCGGDLCVCGRDGEECFGCPDCEPCDDDDFNPDTCPDCGRDEAGGVICSNCGRILVDDDD